MSRNTICKVCGKKEKKCNCKNNFLPKINRKLSILGIVFFIIIGVLIYSSYSNGVLKLRDIKPKDLDIKSDLPKIKIIRKKAYFNMGIENLSKRNELLKEINLFISKHNNTKISNSKEFSYIVNQFIQNVFNKHFVENKITNIQEGSPFLVYNTRLRLVNDLIEKFGLYITFEQVGTRFIISLNSIKEEEVRRMTFRNKTIDSNIFYLKLEKNNVSNQVYKKLGGVGLLSNNIYIYNHNHNWSIFDNLLESKSEKFIQIKKSLEEKGYDVKSDRFKINEVNFELTIKHEMMHVFTNFFYFNEFIKEAGNYSHKMNIKVRHDQIEMVEKGANLISIDIPILKIAECLSTFYELSVSGDLAFLRAIEKMENNLPMYILFSKTLQIALVREIYNVEVLFAAIRKDKSKINMIKDVDLIKDLNKHPLSNEIVKKVSVNLFNYFLNEVERRN